MQKWECRHFETCEAPLCPLDKVSLEQGIWYPDEGICKAKAYQSLEWIKNQKKIVKRTNDYNTYYTVEMLDRHIKVTSAIKGLDPDKDFKAELKKWLKAHPVLKLKKINEEQIKRGKEALKKYHENKSKAISK